MGSGQRVLPERDTVVGLETKTVVGLRPSFSAHVRWCEHGAPVRSCGTRNWFGDKTVVSHISRKTSEMWDTRALVRGQRSKQMDFANGHLDWLIPSDIRIKAIEVVHGTLPFPNRVGGAQCFGDVFLGGGYGFPAPQAGNEPAKESTRESTASSVGRGSRDLSTREPVLLA